jgi:hypothetical protein
MPDIDGLVQFLVTEKVFKYALSLSLSFHLSFRSLRSSSYLLLSRSLLSRSLRSPVLLSVYYSDTSRLPVVRNASAKEPTS